MSNTTRQPAKIVRQPKLNLDPSLARDLARIRDDYNRDTGNRGNIADTIKVLLREPVVREIARINKEQEQATDKKPKHING
ncbi:MAG: hypothetical protein AAGH88_05565 [Planctomycetota bacterium]